MNVLLLSRFGRLAAGTRVRFHEFLPYLEDQGVNVTVAPLLGDDYLEDLYAGKRRRVGSIVADYLRRLRYLTQVRDFDLVWIQYETMPWLPAWAEELIALLGVPYVVDYDDPVFHRYDQHPNRFVRNILGSKIDKVMNRADLVIACNDYLAERAQKAGARRVENLPTVVDAERYKPRSWTPSKDFTIGWIGSPTTAKYLQVVQPALAEVCAEGNGRLVLVGSGKVALEGVPLQAVEWSEETEVSDVQGFDVGIMPLLDRPWERGKCGYKLIQYMACGCPVVASPIGVNRRIVEDGVEGFLASTTTDWVDALSALRDDPVLRERMGGAGRKKVEKLYCTEVVAPKLASLLKSALR